MVKKIEIFANFIAPFVYKYAKEKGFPEYISGAIIAQATFESDCGTSVLSKTYNNFFNIKSGTLWKGKSVDITAKSPKVKTNLTSKNAYRVYDSIEEGIKGYFDFIDCPRYNNLKKSSSGKDYFAKLKADGYNITNGSTEDVYKLYKDNELDKFNYNKDAVKKKPVYSSRPNSTVTRVPKKNAPQIPKVVKFFPKYIGTSTSIINALLSVGCSDTSREYRFTIAKANNIIKSSLEDQNKKMLALLKEGKLIIP